jgi:type II secretory pathway predicted ATPase ExeA
MQAPESSYNAPPFPPFPAASRYIPLGSVQEAMDRVCRSVDAMDAISMIIGPPGTGKSLLCSLIAQQYTESHEIVMLGEIPANTRAEFLNLLLHRLGVDVKDMRESDMQIALMDRVCGQDSMPGGVLMIIDEAQAMPREVMEAVRTVTNISRTGEPRIFAVMCGGAKIDEMLAEPSMEAFNQRVATRCYLHPMNCDETRHYISETIAACGADADETITGEAIAAVHHACCGVPRLINQMMAQAIDCAADNEQTLITEQIIDQAWAELQQLPSPMIEEPKISSETSSEVEFGELSDFGEPSVFDSPSQSNQMPSGQFGGECQFADLNDALDFAEPVNCQESAIDQEPVIREAPAMGCVVEEIDLDQSQASWVEEPAAEEMPESPTAPSTNDLFGQFDEEETIELGACSMASAEPAVDVASQQTMPKAMPMDLEQMLHQEILSMGSMDSLEVVETSNELPAEADHYVEDPQDEESEASDMIAEEPAVLQLPASIDMDGESNDEASSKEKILRIRDDSDILVIEDEVELRADAATDNSQGGSRQAVALDFQSMLTRMKSNA